MKSLQFFILGKRICLRKQIPNPNVLIELGVAIATIGWNRIILILNSEFSEVDKLPFDIERRRVSTYKCAEGILKDQKINAQNKLKNVFNEALRIIIKGNLYKMNF